MRSGILLAILLSCLTAHSSELTDEIVKELRVIQSPRIVGDELVIKGPIDSHIYDFISMEAQKLKSVTKVSLNSLGGNHNWALEIGRRIQELGLKTVINKGAFCASACVYLFGSGQERIAHRSV